MLATPLMVIYCLVRERKERPHALDKPRSRREEHDGDDLRAADNVKERFYRLSDFLHHSLNPYLFVTRAVT